MTDDETALGGTERPGDLERFAIECALDAAWATEFWIPSDPDYGFVDYVEAAVVRNLGLLRGFEVLAEDVSRRGILPQTDSDQARLVTDGGAERQTALTSHAGREVAEPVRDDEQNVRCPDCDQIVSASKGSHPTHDDAPTDRIWGWQCDICENTLPSNALQEGAPTFNDRITAVKVAFRDGHERLVPAPKAHVSRGESA
jgi:uncharacterized C2H2 Zn-finger protein